MRDFIRSAFSFVLAIMTLLAFGQTLYYMSSLSNSQAEKYRATKTYTSPYTIEDDFEEDAIVYDDTLKEDTQLLEEQYYYY